MSHYFSDNQDQIKSDVQKIMFKINGHSFTMNTDNGVFSKSGLDFGSRLLIETVLNEKPTHVLDLGCGYGPIGIALAKELTCEVDMVDVNLRALELAKSNSEINKVKTNVYQSSGFDNISSVYDLIVTNPPIRAGKEVYYPWVEKAIEHLEQEGILYLVVQKKQGAPSLIKKCEENYASVEVVNKKSGYYIIKCRK